VHFNEADSKIRLPRYAGMLDWRMSETQGISDEGYFLLILVYELNED